MSEGIEELERRLGVRRKRHGRFVYEGLMIYLHRDPADFRLNLNGTAILVQAKKNGASVDHRDQPKRRSVFREAAI